VNSLLSLNLDSPVSVRIDAAISLNQLDVWLPGFNAYISSHSAFASSSATFLDMVALARSLSSVLEQYYTQAVVLANLQGQYNALLALETYDRL
jgi:hypothetical protein